MNKTVQLAEIYDESFYKGTNERRIISAEIVLPFIMEALPAVHSAVDIGCGQGAWLSVLKKKGVGEIHGVDGEWVKDGLVIPHKSFRAVNMESGNIEFDKRYDLAISLEVAEHLPPEAAANFVRSLVRASDFVLFSAAIPFQGGTNHINEQWPDYWSDLFLKHEYVVLDFVRGQIWNNEKVSGCYRQNILLYATREKAKQIKPCNTNFPLSIVLPGSYTTKIDTLNKRGIKILRLRKRIPVALAAGFVLGLLIGLGM